MVWFFATMKRRNFLSGLMAAPLALKARFLDLFARKHVGPCGALIFGRLLPKVPEYYPPLPDLRILAQGKSLTEAMGPPIKIPPHIRRAAAQRMAKLYSVALHCSLPDGHKDPHMLLNTR
jgi:hypothetical protein